jgi:hypothetical protein
VSFEALPRAIKRKARQLGLCIYNGGISICPDYEDDEPQTYIRHNLTFVEQMGRLFNLK